MADCLEHDYVERFRGMCGGFDVWWDSDRRGIEALFSGGCVGPIGAAEVFIARGQRPDCASPGPPGHEF